MLHGLGLVAYGYSVSKLLATLKSKGLPVPEELVTNSKVLDRYYVPTRYPNAWAEGTPHEYYVRGDAENAITRAGEIIRWVEETWSYLKRGENKGKE